MKIRLDQAAPADAPRPPVIRARGPLRTHRLLESGRNMKRCHLLVSAINKPTLARVYTLGHGRRLLLAVVRALGATLVAQMCEPESR